jgi:predicted double-glycine peptidase
VKVKFGAGILVILLINGVFAAAAWLDVPYVKQDKNGCGAASVSMVLKYWSNKGTTVSEEASDVRQIMQRLYSKEAKAVFGNGMKAYFGELGFQTFIFKAEWTDLVHHLAQGRPLIVCLKEKPEEASNHFVVIAGTDESNGLVLLNDPAGRKLQNMERREFEKKWTLTENWTLLAVPANQ